ncbi:hypothetical protein NA57DRAFT_64065 [Rhizodiscina lignyota]|uniref:Glycosyltransferase 2 n=1 Tax=Rhizodiscina lignyota TaxID=1504668 RepID=A0A9P4MAT1_9PEZI|nr:hypothetical protein NA57DRAFT_64065 [Rhizodiscina lignyota]
MAASSRVAEKDEELGKRDDSYYKWHRRRTSGSLSSWNPLRYRKRRLLATCVVLLAVYLLFRMLRVDILMSPAFPSSSDTAENESDYGYTPGGPPVQPSGAPPKRELDRANPASKHYYNEVIKFYKLGASLHRISRTMGYRPNNHNILFAASSLQSVANLLPVACEMRRWDRNHVHVALFGRDDLSIEEIQEVNGVDKDTCDIFWHDARPDYAEYSTDLRAETGAVFAFKSINDFMHPQVLITDQLEQEDVFFQHSVKKAVQGQGHPLIQIPEGGVDKLMWMTRLDSESLKAWHKVSVDILVHAPPDSIGSLRRLMQSLSEADYTGLNYPRLIVELPAEVDYMTKFFLDELKWPPKQHDVLSHSNSLIIRHRIPSKKISAEEATVRFAESFYPTHADDSHVLVICPQAQVSPLYFQYLMYNILEYKYSRYQADGVSSLLGLSLDVPSTSLDGSASFVPPSTKDLPSGNPYKEPQDSPIPFLWEAPSSGAALYFGDKWIEIQSFLTNRIDARKKHHPKKKEVSAAFPAWVEYFLELIRARSYAMLYPGLESGESLVIVHEESFHVPEEFTEPTETPATRPAESDLEAFVTPATFPTSRDDYDASEEERPLLTSSARPLHQVLPFDADLPGLRLIPYLSSSGEKTSVANAARIAEAYADHFRREVGGCIDDANFKKGWKKRGVKGSAKDLFCWGDEGEDEWIIPKEEIAPNAGAGENGDESPGFMVGSRDASGRPREDSTDKGPVVMSRETEGEIKVPALDAMAERSDDSREV